MKAYVASRFINRDAVRDLTAKLANIGVECIQTWTEEHEGCTAQEAAIRDVAEVGSADALILYTIECEKVPGGMHFEAGLAHGLGKPLIVIGPRVHVFCHLPGVEYYPTVDEALRGIGQKPATESSIRELRERADRYPRPTNEQLEEIITRSCRAFEGKTPSECRIASGLAAFNAVCELVLSEPSDGEIDRSDSPYFRESVRQAFVNRKLDLLGPAPEGVTP